MAVCNVQELLSANPCYSALSSHMRKVVFTQMLCVLFNNLDAGDPITCDIQTLLDDAACFNALSDDQLEVVQLQLMCEILGLV